MVSRGTFSKNLNIRFLAKSVISTINLKPRLNWHSRTGASVCPCIFL
ncbi:hypothetical protein HMPREF0541_01769 [Lacticaseibacillus rhamnosus ATCC 21052]|nr:hypothetical protein HMPREF0541_01769 [Lacticaseibacillus rhamnosus ATCC 21052]